MNWTNRIVRTADVAPGQLIEHPDNIVIHTPDQEAGMEKLLSTVGWAQRIIVNQRSGRIIDGHMRVSLALRRGESTVPVGYVDLTDDEERKALLYLKRTALLARMDTVNLEAVMTSVQTDDDQLTAMINSFAASAGVLARKQREQPRERVQYVNVTIGPLTFPISWAAYVYWRGAMQSQLRTRHDTINYEIRKRLGLLTTEGRG